MKDKVTFFYDDSRSNFFYDDSRALVNVVGFMNKIFSMVLPHERQRNFTSYDDSRALINVMRFKKSNRKLRNFNFQRNTLKSKIYTHCGMVNHTRNMNFHHILLKDQLPKM